LRQGFVLGDASRSGGSPPGAFQSALALVAEDSDDDSPVFAPCAPLDASFHMREIERCSDCGTLDRFGSGNETSNAESKIRSFGCGP
jgi:hypothetical protein